MWVPHQGGILLHGNSTRYNRVKHDALHITVMDKTIQHAGKDQMPKNSRPQNQLISNKAPSCPETSSAIPICWHLKIGGRAVTWLPTRSRICILQHLLLLLPPLRIPWGWSLLPLQPAASPSATSVGGCHVCAWPLTWFCAWPRTTHWLTGTVLSIKCNFM